MQPRFVRRFDKGLLIAEAMAKAALLKTATVLRLVEDEMAGSGWVCRADELIADGNGQRLAEVNAEPADTGIAYPHSDSPAAKGLDDE